MLAIFITGKRTEGEISELSNRDVAAGSYFNVNKDSLVVIRVSRKSLVFFALSCSLCMQLDVLRGFFPVTM